MVCCREISLNDFVDRCVLLSGVAIRIAIHGALIHMLRVRIISALILQVGTFASILSLYLGLYPAGHGRPFWHWVAWLIYLVLAGLAVWREVKEFTTERKQVFSDEVKISRFMSGWISNPGQTVIFSRDLSWGQDFNSKAALLGKARRRELKLFMQHETEFSNLLAKEGAEVIVYGDIPYDPRSRFTIVGFAKEGGRVAVGTQRRGKQVIYQFESGEDPVYAIAEDLTKIIIEYKKKLS